MILLVCFFLISIAAAVIDILCFGAGVFGGIGCLILTYLCTHLVFAIFVLLIGIPVKQDKPLEKQSQLYRWLVWQIGSAICFYFGVNASFENTDIIPTDTRFLLVSNHRSGFDPLVLIANLYKLNISFICKPSLFKYPVINTLGYGSGFMPIDRDNDRNALRTILTAADYLKRGFCSIGIYPEGTRTHEDDGTMLPFHAGSFKIAQRANVPVVIVSTHGTQNIMRNFPHRSSFVKVRVLGVIPAEKVKTQSTAELADYCAKLIQADVYQENNASQKPLF